MAANATEEELRVIRERLADVADPFDGTWDVVQDATGKSGAEEGPRQDGKLLDTQEAVAWLGLSPGTLERYRVSGEGPGFRRLGARLHYPLCELEVWASARRVSTPAGKVTRRKRKR